jgi:hypothetical protein
MNEEKNILKPVNQPQNFTQRLDFYWKFVSIYAIALIIYSLLRGSISGWTFTLVVYDPIVILLCLFIIGSIIAYFLSIYKRKIIIIGKDFITFHSRFREKTFNHDNIKKISFGREKVFQFKKNIRIIKFYITNRKRAIRIRTSSYWNEKELVQSISLLKKRLNR